MTDVRDRVLDDQELDALDQSLGGDQWRRYALWAREVDDDLLIVALYATNHRLMIQPRSSLRLGYAHGWCYRPGLAIPAGEAWDPARRDEPPYGWHKRATNPALRVAPRRDPADPLNRPRCIHGRWGGQPCQWCAYETGGAALTPPVR